MPLYWIMHNKLDGSVVETVAKSHTKEITVEEPHGARCLRYWLNRETGNVFCLVEGPTSEAAANVHRSGSGLVPDVVIEVEEGPVGTD